MRYHPVENAPANTSGLSSLPHPVECSPATRFWSGDAARRFVAQCDDRIDANRPQGRNERGNDGRREDRDNDGDKRERVGGSDAVELIRDVTRRFRGEDDPQRDTE